MGRCVVGPSLHALAEGSPAPALLAQGSPAPIGGCRGRRVPVDSLVTAFPSVTLATTMTQYACAGSAGGEAGAGTGEGWVCHGWKIQARCRSTGGPAQARRSIPHGCRSCDCDAGIPDDRVPARPCRYIARRAGRALVPDSGAGRARLPARVVHPGGLNALGPGRWSYPAAPRSNEQNCERPSACRRNLRNLDARRCSGPGQTITVPRDPLRRSR
jgi:hypothetical protein